MDAAVNAQVIEALYQAYVTGDLAAFDASFRRNSATTSDRVCIETSRRFSNTPAILEDAVQFAVLTDGTIATKVNEIFAWQKLRRRSRARHR
jgi:hypothetical protein